MPYRLVEARYVSQFVVWLKFADGVEGEIDLQNELDGPVFEPLKDVDVFRRFALDPELRTLVWPMGADFASEFLHDYVRVTA